MKMTTEVKQAVARARQAIEHRNKILAAIDIASSLQVTAEARLQSAMEDLGSAEADAAIAGESISTATPMQQEALSFARNSVDALAARIAGLRRKLSHHDEEVLAAATELEAARNLFGRQCVDEYRAKLAKAAAEFAGVLRIGAALAEALDYREMENRLRCTVFRDPCEYGAVLIDMNTFEVRHQESVHVSSWVGDSAAESIYKGCSEPRLVAKELEHIQKSIAEAETPIPQGDSKWGNASLGVAVAAHQSS